ncbi:MAG TPA: TRAM domain-containing protein, partial [Candidatus Goldiibacteriota bacterium]|nr:TRAM domain-containing protein [Candidatus Goldiibacteriota bacterium]
MNIPNEVMVGATVGAIALIIIVVQAILNRLALAKSELSKKILDTSVIIDGRISEIARAGFLEGMIIVPRFVLQELQLIADSSDGMKRSKGRRGLDILNEFKKIAGINVVIMDKDYKVSNKVDEKLVAMAKDMPGSKIITNDYNLNKIAEIQGIKVLNINDLSNSIKPTFLPGEKISVKIMKEGKEKEQGIAYLNDGTMIVVDGARRMINKRVDISVTNVLQTDAGRMIFARVEGQQPRQGNDNRDNRDNRNRDNRGGFNRNSRGGRNRNNRY